MPHHFLTHRAIRPSTRRSHRCLRYRPQIEHLEGRLAPAVLTVLNTNDSGPGSLRQALLDANSMPGADTITFAAGVTGTVNLASQLPDLGTNIDLEGPGPALLTVQCNSTSSFAILAATNGAAVSVTIAGLTLTRGSMGVIDYAGSLTISNCTIANNSAAGIFAFTWENVAVLNSTIANNTLAGIYNSNSDIGHDGLTIVNNSTIVNNASPAGGGIYSGGGTMFVDNSTIAGNTARGDRYYGGRGGGISNAGTMTISNCTIASNVAMSITYPGPGGPVYSPGRGGGISNSGTLTLKNSTIAGNYALGGTGAGILAGAVGTVTVHNAIIAQNLLPSDGTQVGTDPDVAGSFLSVGHNLIGDGTGGSGFTGPGDQVGTAAAPINPQLGPLAANGGPTLTMAIRLSSPALNAGDNAGAPDTDQRGLFRVVGKAIDIGAYEYQGPFLSPNAQWVSNVYSDLLNRTPDAGGLAFWSSRLDHGASPADVALAILHSTENYINETGQLYQRLLHRAADAPGLQNAVAFLAQGNSVEQLETALLASDEYYQQHGGSTGAFVAGLYEDVLDRAADSAEVAAWQRTLQQGKPRALVAQWISSSLEANSFLAANTYQRFLSRQADPIGLAAWVTTLQQGLWEVLLEASFLSSAEYRAGP